MSTSINMKREYKQNNHHVFIIISLFNNAYIKKSLKRKFNIY